MYKFKYENLHYVGCNSGEFRLTKTMQRLLVIIITQRVIRVGSSAFYLIQIWNTPRSLFQRKLLSRSAYFFWTACTWRPSICSASVERFCLNSLCVAGRLFNMTDVSVCLLHLPLEYLREISVRYFFLYPIFGVYQEWLNFYYSI